MKNFQIAVEETLSRVVEIEAETMEEAIEIANNMYHREQIVLDADDFMGYSIFCLDE